ncbi:MAG: Nif11-like leader peptide family natural product precursor [Oscillatoriales cyanobacterium C42_A2020_001]|nr:Nif11-like leader peptide family natural product precursor [Leptolyngbyaceae cyanobacterium C42_A2020_001]
MSLESASRFLEAVAYGEELREKFERVQSPEEFLKVIEQLGYSFTTAELMTLAKEQSQGVTVRRHTGVWKWLRHINWI